MDYIFFSPPTLNATAQQDRNSADAYAGTIAIVGAMQHEIEANKQSFTPTFINIFRCKCNTIEIYNRPLK